jgi:acyl-homoserine lactone acylase PvdQ
MSLAAPVSANYSAGPYARAGGAFTVDVGTPSLSQTAANFAFGSGANVRHLSVMDPASPVVKMQLPGPERDVPFSSANPALLEQWLSNSYFDLPFGDQIDPVAVASEHFTSE